MKKSTRIILPIVLLFLFSYVSAQQKQDEPNDAKFYIDRGVAYGQKGQFEQAIADFTKAIEIDPKSTDAYFNRAVAYAKKNQHDRAISDYTKALQTGPKDAGTYYYRGIAYLEKRQFDQAADDFTNAIEIGIKDPSAYYYRGIAYMSKGEFDWAIDDFNKALQIDPKSVDAYYNRAIVYFFKKEYDKSWMDIKKVQELGKTIPADFLDKLRKASGKQMWGRTYRFFLVSFLSARHTHFAPVIFASWTWSPVTTCKVKFAILFSNLPSSNLKWHRSCNVSIGNPQPRIFIDKKQLTG